MKAEAVDLVRPVKLAIWAYFWLILLEGVFRKWILPDWSDVIFVARDPLAVLIYVLALRARVFPRTPALVVLWAIAVLSLAFSLESDAPFSVTLFGLRTNYLHPPLVFVMAAIFTREDVIRFGLAMLWFVFPTLTLMWFQFNAEHDSWINVGAGGETSGQMLGALGRVRAPGPFSFVAGAAGYFGFVAAFVIYGWRRRGVYPVLILTLVTVGLAAAIPFSVSRTLLFVLLVVATFGLAASAGDMRGFAAYVGPVVAVLFVVGLAADSGYMEAFIERWNMAAGDGGADVTVNIGERILNDYTLPFEVAADTPLLGRGVGLGTVAGARLATGERNFLLAESELGRIVLELGPVLGFVFIGWRVWLAAVIVLRSWWHLRGQGDALPWLLAGACFLPVLSGQWGPSTQLGFAVFGAGLALAAMNIEEEESDAEEQADEENPA